MFNVFNLYKNQSVEMQEDNVTDPLVSWQPHSGKITAGNHFVRPTKSTGHQKQSEMNHKTSCDSLVFRQFKFNMQEQFRV